MIKKSHLIPVLVFSLLLSVGLLAVSKVVIRAYSCVEALSEQDVGIDGKTYANLNDCLSVVNNLEAFCANDSNAGREVPFSAGRVRCCQGRATPVVAGQQCPTTSLPTCGTGLSCNPTALPGTSPCRPAGRSAGVVANCCAVGQIIESGRCVVRATPTPPPIACCFRYPNGTSETRSVVPNLCVSSSFVQATRGACPVTTSQDRECSEIDRGLLSPSSISNSSVCYVSPNTPLRREYYQCNAGYEGKQNPQTNAVECVRASSASRPQFCNTAEDRELCQRIGGFCLSGLCQSSLSSTVGVTDLPSLRRGQICNAEECLCSPDVAILSVQQERIVRFQICGSEQVSREQAQTFTCTSQCLPSCQQGGEQAISGTCPSGGQCCTQTLQIAQNSNERSCIASYNTRTSYASDPVCREVLQRMGVTYGDNFDDAYYAGQGTLLVLETLLGGQVQVFERFGLISGGIGKIPAPELALAFGYNFLDGITFGQISAADRSLQFFQEQCSGERAGDPECLAHFAGALGNAALVGAGYINPGQGAVDDLSRVFSRSSRSTVGRTVAATTDDVGRMITTYSR